MHSITKLYGTNTCHKTNHYQSFFKERDIDFLFLDVEENEKIAEELRGLYRNRELNFPTITIGEKKLRNPSDLDLNKWLAKLK